MRGISEKRLREILGNYPSYRDECIVIEEILEECVELTEEQIQDKDTPSKEDSK